LHAREAGDRVTKNCRFDFLGLTVYISSEAAPAGRLRFQAFRVLIKFVVPEREQW
jgi:hypothetical protein